jgi:hypothetical protein
MFTDSDHAWSTHGNEKTNYIVHGKEMIVKTK